MKMDEVTGAQLIAESLKTQVRSLQQQLQKKKCVKVEVRQYPLRTFNGSMHNLTPSCFRAFMFANLMFGPAESRVHVWDRWGSYY